MPFRIKLHGDFNNTKRWLNRLLHGDIFDFLDQYGQVGVEALSQYTPKDTGKTAESWEYETNIDGESYRIEWYNTNVVDAAPIAVMLQLGHGTGTGGYVEGRDYINPAIAPVFDDILVQLRKELAP